MKPLRASLWDKLALAMLLLMICTPSYAQDPSFSQFYANRIYLNPAFAGLEPGIGVAGVARMQWSRVDKGFRTYAFTAETQLPVVRMGLGLHLMSNTEGLGNLSTNQAGLVLSYTIPGKKNNVHFGMEGRLVQKTLDWEDLVFSDQLDPVYGIVNESSVVPVLDRVFYGDFDFGVVWRHEGDLKMAGHTMTKVRSSLGVSFHHLPYMLGKSSKGHDSFLNLETGVAPRTTIHGGLIIPMTFMRGTGMDISISPNFKLDMQGYDFMSFKKNLTVGTIGVYSLISNFYLGLLYQNRTYLPNAFHTDAFILSFGGYTNSHHRSNGTAPTLFFGLSVDLNSTGVGPAAGSIFELTFRYQFNTTGNFGARMKGPSMRRNRFLDCKHFF